MRIVKNPEAETMVVYHGTTLAVDELDPRRTIDGGLHFGSYEQARMRNCQRIICAGIHIGKARRSKDRGGDWKGRIAQAKSSGFDAIVYLNRYEGIPLERFQMARGKDIDLDRLTDREFKKLVPEAQDSWIVFDMERVEVLSVEDKPLKKRGPRA